jgi:hypothetical protein
MLASGMLNKDDAARSTSLADGTVIVQDSRGMARLSRLGPGAVLYVCSGYLSTTFYAPMVEVAQREMDEHGRLSMFVDGWELRSIETGFREAWTQWFKAHRSEFHMRLLLRTKLMEMAARLANLFAGRAVIETYSERGDWEKACAKDFRGFLVTARARARR